MKITTHLPHFGESHLLVSAGKREATFYLARNGEINQIHSLKVTKPEYTDKESRTERRGDTGRGMFGGGTPFKRQDDELERSFVKQLCVAITKMVDEHKAKVIYLFCPTYLSKRIEECMGNDLQAKTEYIFYGNYHHQHPFVLLSKVQEYYRGEKESGKVDMIKGEAYEILKNTEGLNGNAQNRAY
jgi:hypothetical protein